MIPHKEELAFLESLASKQQPIYTDSADTGVYLEDSTLDSVREAVKSLKQFYGGRVWTCDGPFMKQAAVKSIMVPYEVEGDMARGVTVSINIVVNLKKTAYVRHHNARYASIDITPFHVQTKDVPALLKDEMDQSEPECKCETMFEGRCMNCGTIHY